MDSWEFYRLIEDRIYGLIPDNEEFKTALLELNVPIEICKWLVDNVRRD